MATGLSVQILSPGANQILSPGTEGGSFRVQVTLDCGCPACAGGRWDPRRFRVEAIFFVGELRYETEARHSGNVSEFEGELPALGPGLYVVEVRAYDPESGMAGRARGNFWVR